MLSIMNDSDFIVDSGLVAVKFWATWCAPCKRMTPIFERVESEFNNVKFFSVDVDQVSSIVQRYRVKMVPTILLLDGGKEVNRINGLVLTEPLRKALRSFTNKDKIA